MQYSLAHPLVFTAKTCHLLRLFLGVRMLSRPFYSVRHHPMAPPFLSSTPTVWFCRLLSQCSNALPSFLLIATSSYGSSFFADFNAYHLVLPSFVLVFECLAAFFTRRDIILWLLLFCSLQLLPFGFAVFCLGVRIFCCPFYSSRHHPMAPFLSSTLTVWFHRLLS